MNFEGLKALENYNMGTGVLKIDHPDQLCEACLLGKHPRKSFPKKYTSRETKPLQLVNLDVCGPINPQSFGKSYYIVFFINDLSIETWISFLKHKYKEFDAVKKFKALAEKQCGNEVQALQTNRSGKFVLDEFYNFCELCQIYHFLTALRSPQQNGVVERKN